MHQSSWMVIQNKHKPWTFWNLSVTSYHIQFLPFPPRISLPLQEVPQWLLIVHRGIHRILLISIPGFRKKSHCYYFPALRQFLFKTWKKPEILLPSITLTKHLQLLPMMSWESVGSGVQRGTDLDSPHWDRGWSSSILHSGVKYGQQILLSPQWTVAHTIKLSYLIQLLRERPCLQADLWASLAEDTPYRSGVMRSLTGQ